MQDNFTLLYELLFFQNNVLGGMLKPYIVMNCTEA